MTDATGTKHDRQFSIPGDKGTRVFVDCYGSGDYVIEVRNDLIQFDFSEQLGPMPTNKDGSEKRSIGPKHKFWRAVSLWKLQGMRLEGKRAIWHEPKRPVMQHLGGRNYLVIEPGEPGWDW